MSQIGSVLNTKRTIMSNNWTDMSEPLARESAEDKKQAEEQKQEEVEKVAEDDEEGSYYSDEGEESEWESEEAEQEEAIIENEGNQMKLDSVSQAQAQIENRSRDKKDGDQEVHVEPEAVAEQKKPFDPRTDKLLDIPDEADVINESLQNFQPPVEEMPDKSLLSIDSRLPDTARRGVRGGIPFDQELLSEDSVEGWQNFRPGYVSPKLDENQLAAEQDAADKQGANGKSLSDAIFSEDDSMNDRIAENPLLGYLVKPTPQKEKAAKIAPDLQVNKLDESSP